jgi:hypothetical protein
MTWPVSVCVFTGVVDLRATPSDEAELVDQASFGEKLRVLGGRDEWIYVQGEDQYFGWARTDAVAQIEDPHESRLRISVPLATVRRAPSISSEQLGVLAAGTILPPDERKGGWVAVRWRRLDRFFQAFVATADTTRVADIPTRPPTPDDLLRTAASFLGVPYLWGGTTARGMDCSGFVQQVYRLNGVALPRDADQQAVLGRQVKEARAGDLFFFGAESVTHVALATSSTEFLHAPMSGAIVERGQLGGDRTLRSIRRYLPEVSEVSEVSVP